MTTLCNLLFALAFIAALAAAFFWRVVRRHP